MPALDRYDNRDIDDEEVGETFEAREAARLRAERDMDRVQGIRRSRLPAALLEGQLSPQPLFRGYSYGTATKFLPGEQASMYLQGLMKAGKYFSPTLEVM